MNIKKLHATFGKFNNESIEFNEGLNVIYLPNESGKSTWCAFIRAMFFGVDSSERTRAGHLPDKIKYEPWSGLPMQGSMDINWEDKDITLFRSSEGKAGFMKNFQAMFTDTSVELDELNGTNAGEKILGVSSEVFKRSAFVEQGSVTVTNSPELEKKITAMVTSGDENVSYSEVEDRLKSWKRTRIYNGRGIIEQLDNELSEKERELSVLEEIELDFNDKKIRFEQTDEKYRQLEKAVTEGRKECRKGSLERLSYGKNMINSVTADYETALKETESIEKEKNLNILNEYTALEAEKKAETDFEKCRDLESETEKKPSNLAATISFILFLISFEAVLNHLYFIVVSALLGILSLIFFLNYRKKLRFYLENIDELNSLFNEYKVNNSEQIKDILHSYLDICSKLEISEKKLSEKEYELEKCRKAYSEIESTTLQDLDFTQGDNELTRLTSELAEAKEERNYLLKLVSQAEGRLSSLKNREVLDEEIQNIKNEKMEKQKEYESICMAMDVLKESEEEIQTRFSPALAKCASEYLSILTDGKYNKIILNRDFTLMVGNTTESNLHKSEYLSIGTVDLVYLAVRLAVCKMTLPEKDKCPIIFDDIFANFDEERIHSVMKLLKEISKERQIILFSCKQIAI